MQARQLCPSSTIQASVPCNIASTSIHRKTHLAVVGERDRRAALDGEHPERVLAGPIKTLKELACSRFGV